MVRIAHVRLAGVMITHIPVALALFVASDYSRMELSFILPEEATNPVHRLVLDHQPPTHVGGTHPIPACLERSATLVTTGDYEVSMRNILYLPTDRFVDLESSRKWWENAYETRGAVVNYEDSELVISWRGKERVRLSGLHCWKVMKPRDLNGNGVPEVLITSFSGGAHCCDSQWIYELWPTGDPKLIFHEPYMEWSADVHHVDDQGQAVFIDCDDVFAYWPYSYAGSPAAIVYLSWDGDTWSLDAELTRIPRPDEAQMLLWQLDARASFRAMMDRGGPDKFLPAPFELYAPVVKLLYGGHPDLAWRLLESGWLPEVDGLSEFASMLEGQLDASPYYRHLPWQNLRWQNRNDPF